MRPTVTVTALIAMGVLLATLLLVLVGAIIGRSGGAWLLLLVALPVIVELVILWQKNMDWLGKFLLTNDGILCDSPLSVPLLLKWEEIEDCCYLSGKGNAKGTFCLCSEKLSWDKPDRLPLAPNGAKFVKISDREGLAEALEQRLSEELCKKLKADRGVD